MRIRLTAGFLAMLLSAVASLGSRETSSQFLGADSKPLPFSSYEQVVDFLRSAREVSSKALSEGITKAQKLRLAGDSLEAHAVFHHINRSEQKTKRLPNGRVVQYLRDSYLSQVAAYELSQLLGMDNVPPTVVRASDGIEGSVQLWIEGAITEERRQQQGLEPPDYTLWGQRYSDMRVFDNLINNIDRNQGNLLVDAQWKLWLIDHTRAFGRDSALPQPETVRRCSRPLWEAIRGLDKSKIEQRLSSYLSAAEIRALIGRQQELIELLEQKISELGEERVLFNYGDPDPGVSVHED